MGRSCGETSYSVSCGSAGCTCSVDGAETGSAMLPEDFCEQSDSSQQALAASACGWP
ncbi:MAG: hypothetical protein AAGA56_08125 [Myxococcota bacterium]